MYTLWLHTYFTAIVSVFRSAMGQNARYLLYSVLEQRDPHDFFYSMAAVYLFYETEL